MRSRFTAYLADGHATVPARVVVDGIKDLHCSRENLHIDQPSDEAFENMM